MRHPCRHASFLFVTILLLSAFLLSSCFPFDFLAQITDEIVAQLDQEQEQEYPPAEELEPAPSPTVEETPQDAEPEERKLVTFGEMEYERPDPEATIERIEEINRSIPTSKDFQELEGILDEAVTLYNHYNSMGTLASIQSSMDKSDSYWLEEETFIYQSSASVQLSYQKLYHTLYDSPFKEQVEEEWGDDYFDQIDDMEYVTDETAPLYEKEADLITQYSEMIVTATVEYNGAELTYSDIMSLSDYSELRSVLSLWYQEYNPILGELYIDLVTVRQEIAHILGFENYAELSFDGDYPDYTVQMVETYLDDIVEYVVPVFTEHAYTRFTYNPSVSMDYDDYVGFLRNALYRLSPDMLDAFDVMEYYELIDYAPRSFKESGAWTTYIYDYEAPYILMSYDDTAQTMSTLVHEFGHFYDYYNTYALIPSSLDTAEIYSQGLEMLVSNHFASEFDSKDGYEMRYDILSETFTAIVEQPLYTAIELRVYSLDPEELTVDKINQISQEEFARFGIDIFYFEEFHMYDWITMPHIYQIPFYTLAYSTSGNVALQLWELSMEDEAQAVDTYHDLLYREQSDLFIENVEAAGLNSPFDTGQAQWIAEFAQKYLIDEDWSEWQDAA